MTIRYGRLTGRGAPTRPGVHTEGVARVIAGEAGGRRLAVPAGRDTRPTSDRAREGLFATISSIIGSLAGARVLDLYAGSGAVGLEALSRGAGHVLLVESGARAGRVIRENIDGARPARRRGDHRPGGAGAGPRAGPRRRGGTTSCSPTRPYALAGRGGVRDARPGSRTGHGWRPEALVIVERATRSGPVRWPDGFGPDRARRYGEATFWYGLR